MSVILADGHSVVRFGLERLLTAADIEVVAVCADGEKTLALVRERSPTLMVMGLNLAGEMESVEVLREIKALPGAPYVLVHTVYELAEYVSSCVLAGADSYLHKRVSCEELVSAVRRTASGEKVWNVGRYATNLDTIVALARQNTKLTTREKDVLTLKVGRRTTAEIAEALGISSNTAKHHITRIYKKLGTNRKNFQHHSS